MRTVDKKALMDGKCTIPSKIIVNNGDDTTTELTQDDYILDWEYEDFRQVPNEGVIGQFVERVVNGNLKNVDDSFSIADKDIELQFAVDRGVEPSDGTTVNGTELTINDVNSDETAIFKLKPSQLTQANTPTPDNPSEVQVIKGNNSIKIENKNLFDVASWVTKGNNSNYYSYSNGLLSINALDTRGFADFKESEKIMLPNGTYYLSNIGNAGIRIYNTGTTTDVRTNQFEVTLGYIYLKLVSSTVMTCQPMIEKGTTATDYVEHQEQVLSLNLPVENLLNVSDRTFSATGNDQYFVSNFALDSTKTYTLSFDYAPNSPTFSSSGSLIICKQDNTYSGVVVTSDSSKKVVRTITNTSSLSLYVSGRLTGGSISVSKVQLELGDKANRYTPFGVTPIEYCKIGTYEDEFEHDGDKWYLNKKIIKVDLGTFSWNNYATNKYMSTNLNNIIVPTGSSVPNPALCEKYKSRPSSASIGIGEFAVGVLSSTTYLYVSDSSGTPSGYMYYQSLTPTHEEITDGDLIEQLNVIENIILYDGQTNISQTNTELPFDIELTYNKVINPYWYSLGNFVVNKPTDDNVKDKTNFKAVDYTKFFETSYEDLLTYPTTAGCVLYSCCKQANVELGELEANKTTDVVIDTTKQYFTYNDEQGIYNYVLTPNVEDINNYYELSFGFKNSDFIIDANYFVNNESCREVAKCIGKLAFSWVRIDWDNKCYLDYTKEDTIEDDEIDNDHYYDLTTNNVTFGELNKIVVGMKDVDGENVTIVDEQSINPDVSELDVWDNPLTNTEEKRTDAIEAGRDLFGLKYQDVEMTTVGHPWFKGKEKIKIKDMEDNYIYTYPFDRTISYNGHIKTKIKSVVTPTINTQYTYEGDISKRLRNTQIQVDKANGQITALVTETESLNDTVTEIGTTYRQSLNEFQYQITQLNDTVTQNNENLQDQIDTLENTVPEQLQNTLVSITVNGIQVSTNLSKISTMMTNDTFLIQDSGGTKLAYFGYDETLGRSVSQMDNLTVTNYFTAGYHRQQKFDINGENRTGWFYTGGV